VIEAWRTSRGTRLVLVFPGPVRFALEPGLDLDSLDRVVLGGLLGAAVGLTATEAAFRAPDGRRWLAQAVGPVWAGSAGAEGVVATRFTSLDGPFERFLTTGSPLLPGREGAEIESELMELWALGRERLDGSTP
jgi:hypothetical protein